MLTCIVIGHEMKCQAVQGPDIEIVMNHAPICLLYEHETLAVTSMESIYLEGT